MGRGIYSPAQLPKKCTHAPIDGYVLMWSGGHINGDSGFRECGGNGFNSSIQPLDP